MDEEDSNFKKGEISCARKIVRRRRSHVRKPANSRPIDMAEARRQIINVLHRHRSSSSASEMNFEQPAVRNGCHHQENYGYNYYYNSNSYEQLVDSIPNVPEPIWSTTSPAVLCCAVPPVEVAVEFESFDNLSSSSYTWWMGFLNSLDRKNMGTTFRDSTEGCDRRFVSSRTGSDVNEVDEPPFTDEWLILPAVDQELIG